MTERSEKPVQASEAESGSTVASLPVRLASGLYFIVTTTLFGFLIGGFLGKVFGSKSAMGWDQLADFLGGVMLGGLVALAGAVVVVRRMEPTKRMIVGTVFVLLIAVAVVVLRVAFRAQ